MSDAAPEPRGHSLSTTIGGDNAVDQAVRKWAVEQAVIACGQSGEVDILFTARVMAEFVLTGTTPGLTAELVGSR